MGGHRFAVYALFAGEVETEQPHAADNRSEAPQNAVCLHCLLLYGRDSFGIKLEHGNSRSHTDIVIRLGFLHYNATTCKCHIEYCFASLWFGVIMNFISRTALGLIVDTSPSFCASLLFIAGANGTLYFTYLYVIALSR